MEYKAKGIPDKDNPFPKLNTAAQAVTSLDARGVWFSLSWSVVCEISPELCRVVLCLGVKLGQMEHNELELQLITLYNKFEILIQYLLGICTLA